MTMFGEQTKLVWDFDGTSYNYVAGLVALDAPKESVETVSLTELGFTHERLRANTIKKTEAGTFSVLYDPANATHVAMNAAGGSSVPVVIEFRNADDYVRLEFDAFIMDAQLTGVDVGGSELQLDITYQPDGAMTETTGALA